MVPAGNRLKTPHRSTIPQKQFIIIITQKGGGGGSSEKGGGVPTLEETVRDAAVITDFDK